MEMARIYRSSLNGRISPETMARYAYMLEKIRVALIAEQQMGTNAAKPAPRFVLEQVAPPGYAGRMLQQNGITIDSDALVIEPPTLD
jgi:hypothetical protein